MVDSTPSCEEPTPESQPTATQDSPSSAGTISSQISRYGDYDKLQA
jgi:hypothetical protein